MAEELWGIFDSRSGKRVTVAGFLSEERASSQIDRWIDRYSRGGRPDVKWEDIEAMEPRKL